MTRCYEDMTRIRDLTITFSSLIHHSACVDSQFRCLLSSNGAVTLFQFCWIILYQTLAGQFIFDDHENFQACFTILPVSTAICFPHSSHYSVENFTWSHHQPLLWGGRWAKSLANPSFGRAAGDRVIAKANPLFVLRLPTFKEALMPHSYRYGPGIII